MVGLTRSRLDTRRELRTSQSSWLMVLESDELLVLVSLKRRNWAQLRACSLRSRSTSRLWGNGLVEAFMGRGPIISQSREHVPAVWLSPLVAWEPLLPVHACYPDVTLETLFQ